VLVVEHDTDVIPVADHVVELGPRSGGEAADCLRGDVSGWRPRARSPASSCTGRSRCGRSRGAASSYLRELAAFGLKSGDSARQLAASGACTPDPAPAPHGNAGTAARGGPRLVDQDPPVGTHLVTAGSPGGRDSRCGGRTEEGGRCEPRWIGGGSTIAHELERDGPDLAGRPRVRAEASAGSDDRLISPGLLVVRAVGALTGLLVGDGIVFLVAGVAPMAAPAQVRGGATSPGRLVAAGADRPAAPAVPGHVLQPSRPSPPHPRRTGNHLGTTGRKRPGRTNTLGTSCRRCNVPDGRERLNLRTGGQGVAGQILSSRRSKRAVPPRGGVARFAFYQRNVSCSALAGSPGDGRFDLVGGLSDYPEVTQREDVVHRGRALVQHRVQLVAVHALGDSRGTVPDQPGDVLDPDTDADSSETKLCRSSRGVHS
jgi:hypothetical protein